MILVEDWSYSEEFRHQCEVRMVIRWRMEDRDRALRYLEGVKQKRGDDKLERDVREQWKMGNRGKENEWKSESEKDSESSGKE